MTVRGYCNCCGKPHLEFIIFNVSENLHLKVITVFLNHAAIGQVQVCCISLNPFPGDMLFFERIWLSLHLSFLLPSPVASQSSYLPYPARQFLQTSGVLLSFAFCYLILLLHSWCVSFSLA